LKAAIAVREVDVIEADIWYYGGDIHVRHERRTGILPFLYDGKMKGHGPGPYSLQFGRYFVRPDIGGLRLRDLFRISDGRKRLLLDVKGRYRKSAARGFSAELARQIYRAGASSWVSVCGQTYGVLNELRRQASDVEVRYSVERETQWDSFMRKALSQSPARQLCIAHRSYTPERQDAVRAHGISAYCWTVDDTATAVRLVRSGVDGIISNDLRLLAALHTLCGV
jgi:hypothetical protein